MSQLWKTIKKWLVSLITLKYLNQTQIVIRSTVSKKSLRYF